MPKESHKPDEIVVKLRQCRASAIDGGLVGQRRTGRADLATRGAEGSKEAAEAGDGLSSTSDPASVCAPSGGTMAGLATCSRTVHTRV
jgi:hypothetical protein